MLKSVKHAGIFQKIKLVINTGMLYHKEQNILNFKDFGI